MSDEARDAVLARVRRAFARSDDDLRKAEEAVAERLSGAVHTLIPERGRRDREGRIELFTEMAVAVQSLVLRLPHWNDVPAAVSRYLREENQPQKLVMAPDQRLARIDWDQQPLMRLRRGTARDEDEVGLSLAVAGIAETGTLLLASSPERPSLLAYLPETSIVLLPLDWLAATYEEALAAFRAREPMPRTLNFITGPSRTADIANKIELGAHGPKRLCIILVDEPL